MARAFTHLGIEDLKIRNMTASAAGTVERPGKNVGAKSGLNRSLLDISPATIRRLLGYKFLWRGGMLVAVASAYTSQRCSRCGHVAKENRESQVVFLCVACGHAAINIRDAAFPDMASTGGLPGLACGSNLGGGRKQKQRSVLLTL